MLVNAYVVHVPIVWEFVSLCGKIRKIRNFFVLFKIRKNSQKFGYYCIEPTSVNTDFPILILSYSLHIKGNNRHSSVL